MVDQKDCGLLIVKEVIMYCVDNDVRRFEEVKSATHYLCRDWLLG